MFERFTDQARHVVALAQEKRKRQAELRDRINSIESRLSILEERVGTGSDARDLDREIAQLRRDKHAALDAHDFDNAAVLRDREKQLLSDKAAREQEWTALPSPGEEIERRRDLLRRHSIGPQEEFQRLRDLLRRHGADPQDGAA
jgi:UvrB/uvrC motif